MKKLFAAAKEALNNSYSIYSNFKVGAALLLKNGEIIIGTNVENASYGLTNCAERSALFSAYSQGFTKDDIEKLLILGDTNAPLAPCGACRQVITELMHPNSKVIFANLQEETKVVKVDDLLPFAFGKDDLNE